MLTQQSGLASLTWPVVHEVAFTLRSFGDHRTRNLCSRLNLLSVWLPHDAYGSSIFGHQTNTMVLLPKAGSSPNILA